MSAKPPSERHPEVTRRQVMLAMGAAGVAGAAGTGIASADEEVFDPESEFAPASRVYDTLTFDEHDRGEANSHFYYVDDAGEESDFADGGASLQKREDDDEVHTPVGYRADYISADAYSDFPRGETKEDADGDEIDVTALDAEEWDVGSAIAAVDESSEASGPGVTFTADDGALTGEETATFSSFDAITSGVARRRLFAVMDVRNIATGASVEIRVVDSTGDMKAVQIEEGGGQVVQERVGDLDTVGEDFDDISEVEFAFEDGDAEIHVVGLDVEREGDLLFGETEELDEDNEPETVDVFEPSGWTWLTGLDTMDSAFDNAVIADLQVDAVVHMDDAPEDWFEIEFSTAEMYNEDFTAELVVNLELPNPFDVTWDSPTVEDTVRFPESRYAEVAYTTDKDPVRLSEMADDDDDDDEYSWTDVTGRYDEGAGEDIVVDSDPDVGNYYGVYYEFRVRESERESLMSGTAPSMGPVDDRDGGILAWVMSPVGALVSALGLAGMAKAISSRVGA